MAYASKQTVLIDTRNSSPDGRKPIMPYQTDAIAGLNRYFDLSGKTNGRQAGMLIMPTGSGKTFTSCTWLLQSGLAKGYRILWLVHRKELVEQTFQEFLKLLPNIADAGIGKVSVMAISSKHASMSQAVRNDITICSIHSLASANGMRHVRRMLGTPGKSKLIVVIDEAHHATMPSYEKALEKIESINHNAIILGLTATPRRMTDNNRLLRMFHLAKDEKDYRGAVFMIRLDELIKDGYLAIPRYIPIQTNIKGDEAYHITQRDVQFYNTHKSLPERVFNDIANLAARNQMIVQEYVQNQGKYGKTLVFAINKAHAALLCEEFQRAGIRCDYITSGMKDNKATIDAFKRGEFPVLINIQIMTEGVDVPDVQTVFLTRETNSDVLFMQMIGRGLRGEYAGGTKECFIVDFHDHWERLQVWFHPEDLDIFTLEDEDVSDPETRAKRRAAQNEMPMELISLYRAITKGIKTMLYGEYGEMHWPVGWYSLGRDTAGKAGYIIVYNDQQDAYEECLNYLEDRLDSQEAMAGEAIVKTCQGLLESANITESDIKQLADFLTTTHELPNFFDLLEVDEANPALLAQRLRDKFPDLGTHLNTEQSSWLHERYQHSERMQAVYRTFSQFERSVEIMLGQQQKAKLLELEERKEYHIEPDYFDLRELLEEVYEMFPPLKRAKLYDIRWTKRVFKSWFARCFNLGDSVLIEVNLLVSSPQVNRETVKYLIYHELLHGNGEWYHTPEFRAAEWSYPESERWDSELDRLQEDYKLDYKALREEAKRWKTNLFQLKKSSSNISRQSALPIPKKERKISYDPYFNPKANGVLSGYKYCGHCGKKQPRENNVCDKCGKSI